jgi:hypothetical protein
MLRALRGSAAGAVGALAASLAFAGLAAAAPAAAQGGPANPDPAVAMSQRALGERNGWRGYVQDSPGQVVYPYAVSGWGPPGYAVNPAALKADDDRAATLRRNLFGQGFILIDLGRNVGGVVEIGIGSIQGGPVRVSCSEGGRFLEAGGDMRGIPSIGINDDPNGRSDVASTAGITVSGGARGAQRHLLVTMDRNGTAQIDFIRLRIRHLRPQPRDYVGRFFSSSPLLNRIWYSGAYTLHLNSIRDERFRGTRLTLADGGKRDRLMWLGDLALQSLAGHYSVRQMPGIVARSLRSFACQQYPSGYIPMAADIHVRCPRDPGAPDGPPPRTRFSFKPLLRENGLPEYTAWWVIAVCDAYRLTGDASAVRRYLPVMRRAIGYMRSQLDRGGLFRAARGAINWRAFDRAAGVDTHTNATWVRALRRLASVERRIGSRLRSGRYRAMAARIAGRLRARMYDRTAGLFVANADSPRGNHAQDANVGAVLAGVVGGRRAAGVLRRERRVLWTPFGPATGEFDRDPWVSRYVSPFMTGWELIARLQRHQGEAALELLQRHWGQMLREGPGTTWEAMGLDGQPVSFDNGRVWQGRTSLSHGWGAAPTYALSAYVAGIRPLAPGWTRWLVEPQRLGLRLAQARVGTPGGPAWARWRVLGPERGFKLSVSGPSTGRGIVAVPLFGRPRTIARDGRVVWRRGRPAGGARAWRRGDYVRFREAGGPHTYAWFGVGMPARVRPAVAPAVPAMQGSADGTARRSGPLPTPRQGGGREGSVGGADEVGGAAPGARGSHGAEEAGPAAVRRDGGVGRLR